MNLSDMPVQIQDSGIVHSRFQICHIPFFDDSITSSRIGTYYNPCIVCSVTRVTDGFSHGMLFYSINSGTGTTTLDKVQDCTVQQKDR